MTSWMSLFDLLLRIAEYARHFGLTPSRIVDRCRWRVVSAGEGAKLNISGTWTLELVIWMEIDDADF